jgi:hypothetical protein
MALNGPYFRLHTRIGKESREVLVSGRFLPSKAARLVAAGLVLAAAAAVAFVLMRGAGALHHVDSAAPSAPDDSHRDTAPGDDRPLRTSESLIAEALTAREITYEESLLQRAYALFDDPRLHRSFRTPVIDWEAIGPLLEEIDEKEATLSRELLDSLEPFRVRPNDPRSIVNRPRAEVLKAQNAAPAPGWMHMAVPGTDLTVWVQGTEPEGKRYADLAGRVWRAFPPFFTYPLRDQPGRAVGFFNSVQVNPDSTIDLYFVNGADLDPRLGPCQDCSLGSNAGWTKVDPATPQAQRASAYLLLDKTKGDDETLDTIAHELTHASQLAYDTGERGIGAEPWMMESTATFVAYKVMKALNVRPAYEYRLIDRREPPGAKPGPQPPLFNHLHEQLHRTGNDYSGFIFFYSASLDLGDGIVKQVWQQASPRGAQGIDAVARAIPLVDHFPRFTVRNWNRDPVRDQYKSRDSTFSTTLRPEPVKDMPSDLGRFELSEPVVNLSARYYRFKWSGPKVKKVTFQNFYKDLPDAHVWAIKQIGTDWKEPEDWSRQEQVEMCRESPQENVTELVVIVSDSHPRQPIDPGHPKPRLLVEDVGCEFIEGSGQSTLRIRDGREDVTYVSSRAMLRFKPRMMQDQRGDVQYDLLPTSVTWTASGTRGDCKVSGQTVVAIPAYVDQPLDPARPAWGYLNVVGLDGGDFHSLKVSAFDPGARMSVTCPGNPPTVTKEPFESVWLAMVVHQSNSHNGSTAVFKGPQTLDAARITDNIPVSPGQALSILKNAPGAGAFLTPEIQQKLKEAQAALEQNAAENSGKLVYTFDWELRPMSGTPP